MNDISEHPVYSKNVLEFITVANDYCLAMGKLETTKKKWLLNYLQKIIPLLYLKASLIPELEVQNPDASERFFTQEEWEFLFNQLRQKFVGEDTYWFLDPSVSNADPIKGSLAECLADIYQELMDFITLYKKNSLDAKENAVFEIKDSFEKRWGYSLVNTHKTIHYLIMNNLMPDEDEVDSAFF